MSSLADGDSGSFGRARSRIVQLKNASLTSMETLVPHATTYRATRGVDKVNLTRRQLYEQRVRRQPLPV